MKKTLTIVSPVYNEELVIGDFYAALRAQLNDISDYASTVIFVVDRSSDNTLALLRDIAKKDPAVRVLALSSRFGYQMSLLAGIDHAEGDAVIMMDSDMQNPPEMIPQFLREYEKGAAIVYTVREDTEGISGFRKLQSRIFYWCMNKISDVPIRENASDFRLISSKVVQVIRTGIRERNLFLRGIFSWVGFTQARISFHTPKRLKGHTKFSTMRLIQFALLGLVSFSRKPLRVATFVGALFAVGGFLFALLTITQYLFGYITQPGYATFIVLLSVFGGLQLVFLGIIGEYIGAIFDEVKARPHYIVEESLGFGQK